MSQLPLAPGPPAPAVAANISNNGQQQRPPYVVPDNLPALPISSQSTDYNNNIGRSASPRVSATTGGGGGGKYWDMSAAEGGALSPYELMQIRRLLNNKNVIANIISTHTNASPTVGLSSTSGCDQDPNADADSEYSEFPETTHAWAVYSDQPQRKATHIDRIVGTSIILFQLFTYFLFVKEAIEDYQKGVVPIYISHDNCELAQEEPNDNFQCEAELTNHFDAAVAFFMLSIFLTPEILQANRAISKAASKKGFTFSTTLAFACLAGFEVVAAFLSAAIAISYQLYIGEVTDAIEVGVGLLFVRELSARAYHGIRHKGVKQYKTFIAMLSSLIILGFTVEALCEHYYAPTAASATSS